MGDKITTFLEVGVRIGFACCSGLASECTELDARQIGALLERMGEEPAVLQAIIEMAKHDSANARPMDAARFSSAMRMIMRLGAEAKR